MRLKTLSGAPLCEHLDFDAQSLPEADQLGHCQPLDHGDDDAAPPPKWRRLAVKGTRLRTGWSQPHLAAEIIPGRHPDPSFSLPGSGLSGPIDENDSTFMDQTTDFLQHSLIFHDTLLSCQLVPGEAPDDTISSSSFLTHFSQSSDISELDSSAPKGGTNAISPILPAVTVTPLGSLPSANHLRSIHPQTLTPNLLCVLTAFLEPRMIYIQKSRTTLTLYEITVADDTKPNFKISFWFRPVQPGLGRPNDPQCALRDTLNGATIGDVLLLRIIALGAFREEVFGQSLNPTINRASSKVEIVDTRTALSAKNLRLLPPSIAQRLKQVSRWSKSHVAAGRAPRKRREGLRSGTKRPLSPSIHEDTLPPDTMESV